MRSKNFQPEPVKRELAGTTLVVLISVCMCVYVCVCACFLFSGKEKVDVEGDTPGGSL